MTKLTLPRLSEMFMLNRSVSVLMMDASVFFPVGRDASDTAETLAALQR